MRPRTVWSAIFSLLLLGGSAVALELPETRIYYEIEVRLDPETRMFAAALLPGIILVAIRMVLLCRAAVGLFQVGLTAVLRDPEDFVVITLCHNR